MKQFHPKVYIIAVEELSGLGNLNMHSLCNVLLHPMVAWWLSVVIVTLIHETILCIVGFFLEDMFLLSLFISLAYIVLNTLKKERRDEMLLNENFNIYKS